MTLNVLILIPAKNKPISLLIKCCKNNSSETYSLCDNRKENTAKPPQNILMNSVKLLILPTMLIQ